MEESHFILLSLVLLVLIREVHGDGVSVGAIIGYTFLAIVALGVLIFMLICCKEVKIMLGIQKQQPTTTVTAFTIPPVQQVPSGFPPQSQQFSVNVPQQAGLNPQQVQTTCTVITPQPQAQALPYPQYESPPGYMNMSMPPPPYPGK